MRYLVTINKMVKGVLKLHEETFVDAPAFLEAKKEIRETLKAYRVRSINLSENNRILVTIEDRSVEEATPRVPGKPVSHEGPIGRGRRLR